MHKTILLAESDDAELALLTRAFGEAGIAQSLQTVRSPAEAMRFLAGEPPYKDRSSHPIPALLLLGAGLGTPGSSEVLRWLRQNPELKKQLPVAVLSPLECAEEMEAAYAWGANSCVVRPTDFTRLVLVAHSLGDYWLGLNQLPHFM